MGLFLVVMIVILLAYGIAAQGLLYTERSPSWAIIKDVFYFPYWMIYGEIFVKSIGVCDGDKACNSTRVAGERDCLTPHWMVPFILAAYLMIGGILLLNLLIAIFSNVVNSVERNSFQIWKFDMYYLVMEYSNKTFLVPPLSILVHVYLVVTSIVKKLGWSKPRDECLTSTIEAGYLNANIAFQNIKAKNLKFLIIFTKNTSLWTKFHFIVQFANLCVHPKWIYIVMLKNVTFLHMRQL
ncbi:transient receptor potential cation channel subfamily M member 1-like [Dreissena polymorpha]|uniref:Ion transport domain-containing protein n=1 Tax=Dreissena polymorpha TaxID=45954 RepID=A0A9D4CTL1_DREPO|nr:transient receptor potential cation channel subfamily M member 1-like [Dreissena polymorpha]KAH3733213.1 hypothetical protein DPMN_039638 [Dreissena polymorpha]